MTGRRTRFGTGGSPSLRLELTLWWCALLVALLTMFLWTGYRAMERTLLEAGAERAQVAAQQVAQLVGRAVQTRGDQMAAVAVDDAIRRYVHTPTPELLQAARTRALSLATPQPYRIAVWNTAGDQLFEVEGPLLATPATRRDKFPPGTLPTQLGVNAFRSEGEVVFSQTVVGIPAGTEAPAASAAGAALQGYVVLRAIVANPGGTLAVTSADLLARLVGSDATMAMGNTTGDGWTNLARKVPAPPTDLAREQITTYGRGAASRVGALALVPATPWAIWVEFPSHALLAPARRLLRERIVWALACLLISPILVASVLASSMRSLGDLARAARDIAAGNYARRVVARRRNEIGEVAESFNLMASRVEQSYRDVEQAHAQTQSALTSARMGVWEANLSSSEVTWSPAMAAVYGLTPDTAPRTIEAALACVDPADRAMVAAAVATHEGYTLEFRVVWPDGTTHWVNSRVQRQPPTEHSGVRLLGVNSDITERKALEDALFAEKERAEVTLHSIGDAVISTGLTGRVTYLNAAAERLTGWLAADAAGRPLLDVLRIVDATTRAAMADPSASAMRLEKVQDLGSNCLLLRRDGSEALIEDSAAPIHDRERRVTGAVIVFRDVSVERALTLKMARLGQYDVLTNLPNRTLFDDRIAHATALARRNGTRLAVLFLDLDRFKQINDSLGHTIGDALLKSVTSRLLASVRASDTVSRRGGDEFVLLLGGLERPEPAGVVSDKILAALAEPHTIAGHVLHAPASIGISIYPDDALDPEALIAAADAAMYHAKQSGRSNSQFFTSEMNVRTAARRSLESSIRKGVERGEFVLHYQPRVNLASSIIVGMEALVRWEHPTRGVLLPAEFMRVAEECGLILPLGRWVLGEVCRQARSWRSDRQPSRVIAVNVSALEFRTKGFIDYLASVLAETDMDPSYLELEVTETILMAHAEMTAQVLQALKELGVGLAIADFGTGYSSLSHLSRFPIDTLKIDQSFVQGMTSRQDDAAIINAIIGMAHSLNHCVVAEGVETAQQLALLQDQHCSEGQGDYFSRPLTADLMTDLLRRQPPYVRRDGPCGHAMSAAAAGAGAGADRQPSRGGPR